MIEALRSLFDSTGFPAVATYGQSWQPWLVQMFIVARVLAFSAYLILLWAYAQALRQWYRGSFDPAKIRIHLPRVAMVYLPCVGMLGIQSALSIVVLKTPVMRLFGWVTLASAVLLVAAAAKTVWALRNSLKSKDADAA